MFEHPSFKILSVESIPLDTDIYLRDVKFMAEYEQAFLDSLNGQEWRQVGYVSFAAARKITSSSIELSWYVNIFDRYHEVRLSLPRDQVVCCIEMNNADEKPSIFVTSAWLDSIYRRTNCVFGMVDAINVRRALRDGLQLGERLPLLSQELDRVSGQFPEIAFISFADSVVLKSNWTTGYLKTPHHRYEPEMFLRAFREIQKVFKSVLGLDVYGVFTQGCNEFPEAQLLHVSESKNHISLNSLGAPFADLKVIEESARKSIRANAHTRYELYLDETFYHSLTRKLQTAQFKSRQFNYVTSLEQVPANYICASCDELLDDH